MTESPHIVAIGLALLACGAAAADGAGSAHDAARSYVARHERDILRELTALLEIPNVAADTVNIRRNAAHIAGLLEDRGVTVSLLELEGSPPAVHGELRAPDAAFTLMVYAHYDGQPVTPGDWASPPWQPVLRAGRLEDGARILPEAALDGPMEPDWRVYARSAGDDKAPIVAALRAIDALEAAGIPRAVNLKFFFEGEEEAGSPHLEAMLERHAGTLAADLWLFCDGPRHQSGRPQLAFGVRGVTGVDLTVYGPVRALHSGHYGNWAPNPAAMLAHLLAGMRDPEGRILIEGIAEAVRPPARAELEAIAAAPPVDAQLLREFELGHSEGGGQRLELRLLEPALNIKGLSSGAVGESAANAIPASASAALGFRLVPDLTPARLRELVEAHVRDQGYLIVRGPPDAPTRRGHARIARLAWDESGYPAARTDMTAPPARALIAVMQEVVGDELILMPTMGGSLPLYMIGERLGAPFVILPIANHDNNQHAANENLRLGNLFEAVATFAAVFAGFDPAASARSTEE